VTNKNKLHFGFDCFQGVKNWDSCSARVSEYEFYAEIVERFDESLSSVECLIAHEVLEISLKKGEIEVSGK
jgi:predicted ATP-dependent Lon-type protease